MRFKFHHQPCWPQLSWVASGRPGSDEVQVFHGSRVETRPNWFGEIVWDGRFDDAAFDETDIVVGSGARLRDGRVVFVSAASTVDRLVTLTKSSGGEFWISNSLPGLLAMTDGSLRPSYPTYIPEILSIMKGIRKYHRQLVTTNEPVELVYYDNIGWDGCRAERIEKPFPQRDFGTFDCYHSFLRTRLERLSENLHDAGREFPFKLVATISSGYDSPTIAALAREHNCQLALTFAQSRYGENDSGAEIGRRLGLEIRSVDNNAWRQQPPADVEFYGVTGYMGAIVYAGHQENLSGAVLLTGYHGDAVWGTKSKYSGSDLVRGDASGLALTEYRLKAGFIHCPVAFFGARQIDAIHEISRRPEMDPWSLPGTDYDRPICRRIVEQSGVPRDWFGMRKLAIGVDRFTLSKASRASYMQYLREHQQEWIRERRIPPIRVKWWDDCVDFSQRGLYRAGLSLELLRRRVARRSHRNRGSSPAPAPSTATHAPSQRQHPSLVKWIQSTLVQPRNLHRYIVPWAIEQCKLAYRDRAEHAEGNP